MADQGIPRSSFPCNDDSGWVHQAMADLGFVCEFYDLPLTDQQLTLALALHLKRIQGRQEAYES